MIGWRFLDRGFILSSRFTASIRSAVSLNMTRPSFRPPPLGQARGPWFNKNHFFPGPAEDLHGHAGLPAILHPANLSRSAHDLVAGRVRKYP
jgi:hypothetical protein